jgi:hypothetical protein
MIIQSLKSTLLLFLISIFVSSNLFADDTESVISVHKQKIAPNQELDPRLPPVIPGEELTRAGKKIKVWSTGGSPSVSIEPPLAAEAPVSENEWKVGDPNNNFDVIVDGRGRRRGY